MSLNVDRFAESSAYLRVQEKKLLTSADCDRAADAGGVSALFAIIAQGGVYNPKAEAEIEPELERGLAETYALAYKLCGEDRAVADIPAAKHSFLRLKAEVKGLYANADVAAPVYAELPAETAQAARDAAIAAYEAAGDPAAIDIAADKAWAGYVTALCHAAGNEFISGYIRLEIDCLNLRAFTRANGRGAGRAEIEALLLEGGDTPTAYFAEHSGKSPAELAQPFYYRRFGAIYRAAAEDFAKRGHFAALERLTDNALIGYLKQGKLVAYGPEVLFAYILSRENEARQIRLLAAGLRNGLQAAAIRERLRDNYV